MRLKQSRIKTYTLRRRLYEKNNEGVPRIYYVPDEESDESDVLDNTYTVKGYLWEVASNREIAEVGDKVTNKAYMRVEGEYKIVSEGGVPMVEFADGRELRLNDGLYVYADIDDEPDYVVVKIIEHPSLRLEVERLG